MSQSIITRFAPSPTGFLHIGGARTALFNWLFAKHFSGKMLLRIEDTDRKRSTPEAVEAILDGLSWLGLTWDGAAVSQFSHGARHKEIAEQLVKEGKAYYCYASPEELEQMREQARLQSLPPRYNGLWRDKEDVPPPSGIQPVIRIKAPQQGTTIINDLVQGKLCFENKQIDDFVILRSDGSPTYMLAVVVDDHDMGVTHIIRGDDHLTNAAKQTLLYQALGWEAPIMAHIPLIHGADGAKLSKRHGALGVQAYREMGYLPQALRNYLVRLGWSHGNDEIIALEDMIAWFDGSNINKSAARFDFKKLDSLNAHYIKNLDDKTLYQQALDLLPYSAHNIIKNNLDTKTREQFLAAISSLKLRAKTLHDLLNGALFIFQKRPLPLEEEAKKLFTPEAHALLNKVQESLQDCPWQHENLEITLKEFCNKENIKFGQLAPVLRAALTGKTISTGVFDILFILGREESLARLNDAIMT